jgi:hypothetical protein
LYAYNGVWWIQPFVKQPFTEIQTDSTWKNRTHLGTEYAAILVEPDYLPLPKTGELPALGNGVVAIFVVPGTPGLSPTPDVVPKTINFSGYEWTVHDRTGNRGGTVNVFDPENVWTDEKGYLHLRIAKKKRRVDFVRDQSHAQSRLRNVQNRCPGYGVDGPGDGFKHVHLGRSGSKAESARNESRYQPLGRSGQ